ncbi:hypothetical protein SLA2020_452740 [Shorea laevis]
MGGGKRAAEQRGLLEKLKILVAWAGHRQVVWSEQTVVGGILGGFSVERERKRLGCGLGRCRIRWAQAVVGATVGGGFCGRERERDRVV